MQAGNDSTSDEINSAFPGISVTQLFAIGLREMHAAEASLMNSLPELSDFCANADLAKTLREQARKAERQKQRIEKIFERLQISNEAVNCKPVSFLLDDLLELIKTTKANAVRDAAIIITLQKVEHYQISSYGSLYELADLLGFGKIADELDRSLEEEEFADLLLSNLAWIINDDALGDSQEKTD